MVVCVWHVVGGQLGAGTMANWMGVACTRMIIQERYPEQEALGSLLCSSPPSWGVEDEFGGVHGSSRKATRKLHKLTLEGTHVPWQNISKGERLLV